MHMGRMCVWGEAEWGWVLEIGCSQNGPGIADKWLNYFQ